MVNNPINVSAYAGTPPADGESRKIQGGPLYGAEAINQILLRGEESFTAWTRKCKDDLQKYALDGQDVVELIAEALRVGRYRDSEWCRQNSRGPWAACDAYTLTRKEWIPHAHKEFLIEYYIKFAISKTGTLVLLVSCHLPEDRG
jgi:hypothetical protein